MKSAKIDLRIDEKLRDEFRNLCADRGVTVSAALIKFIRRTVGRRVG